MNWLRLYVDITRDHKIRREPTGIRWTWIAVLTLARRSPKPPALLLSPGLPVRAKDLADEANVPARTVTDAIDIFIDRGMLHVADVDGIKDVWIVTNWDKRQPSSDDVNQRVQAHRQRQRNVTGNGAETGDATAPETERETEAETDSDANASEGRPALALVAPPKPTQAEVFSVLVRHFGEPAHGPDRTAYGKAARLFIEAGASVEEVDAVIRFAKENWNVEPSPIPVAHQISTIRRAMRSPRRRNGGRSVLDANGQAYLGALNQLEGA